MEIEVGLMQPSTAAGACQVREKEIEVEDKIEFQ